MVNVHSNLFSGKDFQSDERWTSQFINAIYHISDELNLIIDDVGVDSFEKSIFEYNERFFVGVFNNVLVRLNPYYVISTIQEFSTHNEEENKAIGRADLLIYFKDGKENKTSILVEVKKWKASKKTTKEGWNFFFDTDRKEGEWFNVKDQIEKYTKDTFALKLKPNKKLILIFEHIISDKKEEMVVDYMENLQEYADFFQVISNTKKDDDFMVVYGKFV